MHRCRSHYMMTALWHWILVPNSNLLPLSDLTVCLHLLCKVTHVWYRLPTVETTHICRCNLDPEKWNKPTQDDKSDHFCKRRNQHPAAGPPGVMAAAGCYRWTQTRIKIIIKALFLRVFKGAHNIIHAELLFLSLRLEMETDLSGTQPSAAGWLFS